MKGDTTMKRVWIGLCAATLLAASVLLPMGGCTVSTNDGEDGEKEGGDLRVVSFYNIYADDDTTAVGKAIKEYEETYGANVEYTQYDYSVYNNKLLQLAAGGNTPDVIFAYWGDMPRLAAIQLIQPVEPYLDVTKQNLQDLINSYVWQGKHYAASVQQVQTPLLWFNKTLLERAGITETPYDLWKAGNWNWDTFLEMAKKLTSDSDGDGEIDRWGFNTYNNGCFHWSNSATKVRMTEDGGVKITWKEDAYINATKFLQQLRFTDNVLSQDGSTTISDFGTGITGMSYGTYEMLGSIVMNYNVDPANYGVAPFPTGPDFDGHYYAATNLVTIGNNCANPTGAGQLATLICEKERELFGDAPNLASPDYTKYLDDQAMEVITYSVKDAQTYYEEGWGNWDPTYIYNTNLLFDTKDPVTILDSIEPMFQAAIDDMLASSTVINSEFQSPGTVTFDDGMDIFVSGNDGGSAAATTDAAEVIEGAGSLKITSTDLLKTLAYTDTAKLSIPTYKVYKVTFDYKITAADADNFASFAVAARTKSTVNSDERQTGWVAFEGEVGATGQVEATLELMGDGLTDYVICLMSNTSTGSAVIDNFTMTDVTPSE